MPNSMGKEVPMLRTLLDLTLCIPTSGCASISFLINCNSNGMGEENPSFVTKPYRSGDLIPTTSIKSEDSLVERSP